MNQKPFKTIDVKEINPEKVEFIDKVSGYMDDKFRIPGTQIRFGIDAIIGFFPFFGVILTHIFSGTLLISMAKHGASTWLVIRMLLNICLDGLISIIPIFGNFFDIFYKANRRNMNLYQEYLNTEHEEERGNAFISVTLAILSMVAMFLGIIYAIIHYTSKITQFLIGMIF